MDNNDCIFCKLANGVFPTNKLYEDDEFTVILDASPANRGHALILPKSHYANLYEIDDAVSAKVLPLARRVAGALTDELGCDGINIVQNNGTAAGQTVFHFHVHVIPRYDNDDFTIGWPQGTPDPEDQAALAEQLAARLESK